MCIAVDVERPMMAHDFIMIVDTCNQTRYMKIAKSMFYVYPGALHCHVIDGMVWTYTLGIGRHTEYHACSL